MNLNNTLITNKSEFIDNFSIKEAYDKIPEICVFFEDVIGNLTDKEEFLISSLKKTNCADCLMTYDFEYAKSKSIELREKYEQLDDSEKEVISKVLILFELAENSGEDIDFNNFISKARFEDVYEETIPDTMIIDITNHIGVIKLEKYCFNKKISKDNTITRRTYVNKSMKTSDVIELEIYDSLSNKTYSIKISGGYSITGLFVDGKVVAFLPTFDLGAKHFIAEKGKVYKRYSAIKKDFIEYNLNGDVTSFAATNDGAVFIIDNEVKLFSDEQLEFDYELSRGEVPIMACARANRYLILTNYGHLITNRGDVYENICYVTMRPNGEWYAISEDGQILNNIKRDISNVEVISDIEEINFGKYAIKKQDCIEFETNDMVHYSFINEYTIKETITEFVLKNTNGDEIIYEK